jgi:hypothetical protein
MPFLSFGFASQTQKIVDAGIHAGQLSPLQNRFAVLVLRAFPPFGRIPPRGRVVSPGWRVYRGKKRSTDI